MVSFPTSVHQGHVKVTYSTSHRAQDILGWLSGLGLHSLGNASLDLIKFIRKKISHKRETPFCEMRLRLTDTLPSALLFLRATGTVSPALQLFPKIPGQRPKELWHPRPWRSEHVKVSKKLSSQRSAPDVGAFRRGSTPSAHPPARTNEKKVGSEDWAGTASATHR